MKKLSKILLGTFFLMILFSTMTSFNVVAVGNPDNTVAVNMDTHQAQIQTGNMTMFQFRQRTQLRLNASVNLDVTFDCDALRIGNKDFAIEIEGTGDLKMNMTCTEEQAELGLLNGNINQIRNRNRNQYQYQEGFVISIECNGTFTRAKLSLKATNENRIGEWAYYDEATEEWVSVPTTVEDGYLTAEVSHFSTWTILIPDYTLAIVGFSIGGVVVALIIIGLVFYIKKRK
jgi:hypothetical protein